MSYTKRGISPEKMGIKPEEMVIKPANVMTARQELGLAPDATREEVRQARGKKSEVELKEWQKETKAELGLSETATRAEVMDARRERSRKEWASQLGLPPEATWDEIAANRQEWVKAITDEQFWSSEYYNRLDQFQHAIAEHGVTYGLGRNPTLEQIKENRKALEVRFKRTSVVAGNKGCKKALTFVPFLKE